MSWMTSLSSSLTSTNLFHSPYLEMEALCVDLEGALVHYHTRPLRSLAYDILARRLVHAGHSDMILDSLWTSRALEFAHSSLVLDCEHGTVLSLGLRGEVVTACFGLSFLSETDIKTLYGDNSLYPMVNGVSRVPGKYWACLSQLSAVLPALYVICIEMITRQQTLGKLVQSLEEDLDQVWRECFDSPGSLATVRSFYEAIYRQPGLYLKVNMRLPELLEKVRSEGKVLILITNESEKYTDFVCRYVLGKDWLGLFDEFLPEAGKSAFFTSGQLLSTKYPKHSFTSLGSHFINDIFTPKNYLHWKTVAILPEPQSESRLNPTFADMQCCYWLEFLGVYSDAVHPSLESYLLTC